MAGNTNTLNYWLRNGAILPPYMLGATANTTDLDYWLRAGTVIFKAAIPTPSTPPTVISSAFLNFT